MNRFDISLFGFRLIARGNSGIVGALAAIGMLIVFAVVAIFMGEVPS